MQEKNQVVNLMEAYSGPKLNLEGWSRPAIKEGFQTILTRERCTGIKECLRTGMGICLQWSSGVHKMLLITSG